MSLTLSFDDYTIAWLAVLPIEAEAALGMLDKRHEGSFETKRSDDFLYIGGEINDHNVVIATWPSGQNYGPGSAAALANQVKARFGNIWFALLVGVAAGLPILNPEPPAEARDIRLGDVLVCVPEKTSSGIVHYDLGKDIDNDFILTSRQAEPPSVVRSAIANIQLTKKNPFKEGNFLAKYLAVFQRKVDNNKFLPPCQSDDKFFLNNQLVSRAHRDQTERTLVWYGTIGSGCSMMRNSRRRDELRDTYDLIGLEMEAAGVMNTLPTGVIRGVCDYGDNWKNKDWQPYAAAVAAAYAKGILCTIRPEAREPKREDKPRPANQADNGTWNYERHFNLRLRERFKGTCEWFFDHRDFVWWYSTPKFTLLWLSGTSGIGKSTLLAHVVSKLEGSETDVLPSSVSQLTKTVYSFCHTQILNSAQQVISNVICDLLDHIPELRKDAKRIQPRFGQRKQQNVPYMGSQISAPRLWHLLKELLKLATPHRIYVIIDALDECDRESQAELIYLFGSSEEVQNLNILFSSRNDENVRIEYSKLQKHLASCTRHLEMDIERACVKGINRDIDCFLSAEIPRIVDLRGFTPEDQITIENYLRENHSGLFLFVKLVVKRLERAPVNELNQTLRASLPRELAELYEHLLSEIPRSLRTEPPIRLMLLMYACEPLSLRQIATFTTLVKESLAMQDNLASTESPQAVKNDLRLFGSLLRIRQDESIVDFIHPSAKEYLIKASASSKHAKSLVPPNLGHERLAIMCLTKLLSSRNIKYPATWMNSYGYKLEQLLKEHPTLAYSLQFWYQHLQKIPELSKPNGQICQHLRRLMYELISLWRIPKYTDFFQVALMHTRLPLFELQNNLSLFEYFSWLGLCAFISPFLVSNSHASAEETNHKAEYALRLAISAGHKEASALIISHFHITSLDSSPFARIYTAAVKSGDVALVDMVSKMSVQSPYDLASAVPEAFRSGKVKIFLVLRANRVGLSVKDAFGSTALHRMFNRDKYEKFGKDIAVTVATAQYLVQHGVEVNSVDRMGNTALHYACCTSGTRNEEQPVLALLEQGADPRIRNMFGWTAFDLAVRYVSNSRILQILLRAGGTALISSRSNGGRTTLHWAAQRYDISCHDSGGYNIIRCLLLNGADPNIPFKGVTSVDIMSKRSGIRDAFESVYGLIGNVEPIQALPIPETVIDDLDPSATGVWALAQAQQQHFFIPSASSSQTQDDLSDNESFYSADEG